MPKRAEKALGRAGRIASEAGAIFDGAQAPSAQAEDAFPIAARAGYAASLRAARRIPLAPGHLAVLQNRIGLGDGVILGFSGRTPQSGKTCARHAMAACAEANGRAAGPGGLDLLLRVSAAAKIAKLAFLRKSLLNRERAKAFFARNGRDVSRLEAEIKDLNLRIILADAFPEQEGLSERERRKTAEFSGLDYRFLGRVPVRAAGLTDPEAVGPFLQASAALREKIDGELAQKNAVMAGIYTGARKDGGSGLHAVAVLGKGRRDSGKSFYIIYDSNAGRPSLYPAKKLHVFTAAVVK